MRSCGCCLFARVVVLCVSSPADPSSSRDRFRVAYSSVRRHCPDRTEVSEEVASTNSPAALKLQLISAPYSIYVFPQRTMDRVFISKRALCNKIAIYTVTIPRDVLLLYIV